MIKTAYHPQFFTATILEWKSLLADDVTKEILIASLRFLVKEKRVLIYNFVIMPNHIHIIWQAINEFKPAQVQHSFLKFTAQQIKFYLQKNNPALLESFRVNAADRNYQIWERNPLSIDLFTEEVYFQKAEYIHNNPVKAGLCKQPQTYEYSSAVFYETLIDRFDFLTHWRR
jgi:putative transposase